VWFIRVLVTKSEQATLESTAKSSKELHESLWIPAITGLPALIRLDFVTKTTMAKPW
jgi:hypothetical protein